MDRLDIALCITDLDVGGAEKCLVELTTRLDRDRFRPVVYALGPRPDAERAWCVSALERAGIEVHCLGGRGNCNFFRILRRLTRLFSAQQPQLVQTFMFHANIAGRIAARRTGARAVVSGIRVAQPHQRWRLWLDRATDRLVDAHVCVSHSVADFAREKAGLPADKLVVIPNGVDLQRFPAGEPANLGTVGIEPDRCVVTYVGRLDRQKGVAWLIETASAWLRRLPDCDLLMVGEGPQRAKLEQIVRHKGISDRVHFAGRRPDVPEILAASRLLVLPSAWEGMPNVVLEAMASRLPVLATRAEGVEELLGPAAAEQTVPYGDGHALAEMLATLVENTELAANLGRRNRKRVEENSDIVAMVADYERLWESLVQN